MTKAKSDQGKAVAGAQAAETDGLQPIYEDRMYGAILRALRERQFARGQDFCDAMATKTRLRISERTLYELEKGKQEPTFREALAMLVTLKPELGIRDFLRAADPDIAEDLLKMMQR
jgi:hypothetical protein